jgi:mRNA-degrading endonuclease toxin of MazEF toxin-antitoxin module
MSISIDKMLFLCYIIYRFPSRQSPMFIKILTGEKSITGHNVRLKFYKWVLKKHSPSTSPPTKKQFLWQIFESRSMTGLEGKVYWATLTGAQGHEIMGKGYEKTRPVLIIRDMGATAVVVPLTSKFNPKNLLISVKESYANIGQIRTLDKGRLRRFMFSASQSELSQVLMTCFTEILCPLTHTP